MLSPFQQRTDHTISIYFIEAVSGKLCGSALWGDLSPSRAHTVHLTITRDTDYHKKTPQAQIHIIPGSCKTVREKKTTWKKREWKLLGEKRLCHNKKSTTSVDDFDGRIQRWIILCKAFGCHPLASAVTPPVVSEHFLLVHHKKQRICLSRPERTNEARTNSSGKRRSIAATSPA